MSPAAFPPLVLSWLANYLIHSTLLLGGVWLLLRGRPIASVRLREGLWTFAVWGGLVSATLSLVPGLHPRLSLPFLPRGPGAVLSEAPRPARSIAPLRTQGQRPITPGVLPARDAKAALPVPAPDPFPAPAPSAPPLHGVLLLLGLAAAALALLGARRRLGRLLRGRRPVTGGPLAEALEDLRRRAGCPFPVGLSLAPGLAVPLSFGFVRREIALPPRCLDELSEDQCRAVLAHELAHCLRRDPLRSTLLLVLQRLLFVQPLNRLARRELADLAELACDDLLLLSLSPSDDGE